MAEDTEIKAARSRDWALGEALWRDGAGEEEIARRLRCRVRTVREHAQAAGWTRAGETAAAVAADLARRFRAEMARAEDMLAQGESAGAERHARALSALAHAAQRFAQLDPPRDRPAEDDEFEDPIAEIDRRIARIIAARGDAEGDDEA